MLTFLALSSAASDESIVCAISTDVFSKTSGCVSAGASMINSIWLRICCRPPSVSDSLTDCPASQGPPRSDSKSRERVVFVTEAPSVSRPNTKTMEIVNQMIFGYLSGLIFEDTYDVS